MAETANGRLDEREQAVLAAALDRLIPADAHGPGAIEAGVPEYVERALAGPLATHRAAYATGLTALDGRARSQHGMVFAALGPAERDDLLRSVEASTDPDEAAFFQLLRQHAVEGMFADPLHGGNRGHAGWRLLGAPGSKGTFEAPDQAIDVEVAPSWAPKSGTPTLGKP